MAKKFWALRMPHPYLPCLALFNNKGHVCPYLLTGLNKANKEPQNPYLPCLALLKDKDTRVPYCQTRPNKANKEPRVPYHHTGRDRRR